MSNIVSLHCPHCGTKLKIKDHTLFGQSVKCPGCKKSFVLRNPNEPAPTPASTQKTTKPAFPDFSKLGDSEFEDDVPPMFSGTGNAVKPPAPPSLSFPTDFATPRSSGKPSARTSFTEDAFSESPFPEPVVKGPPAGEKLVSGSIPPVGLPAIPPDLAADSVTELLVARRQRTTPATWIGRILILLLVGVLGGLGAYYATQKQPVVPSLARNTSSNSADGTSAPISYTTDPNQPYSKLLLERDGELVAEFKPTHGQPIELYMMPSGINMLIHLRPAQLWSDTYNYKVLRASLTDDLMSWLGARIKTFCLYDPAQIEELTIGVMLGARGTPPQYCCVVRLVQPEKLSSLIDLFPGKYLYEITTRPDLRIKVDDQYGYLIHDEKTYAICPASMAADLEYSIKTPNQDISVGMSELLKRTDRQRLLTAVADIRDLGIHLDALVPAAAQPFLHALTEWVGEDIELASWSIHPEPYFHSELALRPVTTKEVASLDEEMQQKLEQLPQTVWKDLCARMQPREMRFRKLIGRLPAMLAAFQESTVSRREKRCVMLTTVLPAKATPNLALATMFTIDEAARTNFTTANVASTTGMKPRLPETVAERLKLKVDAEFNRTPLEQALTYLCGEIQVNLHVDGDALKDAGYTKNMPQTFNLGKVPMQRALFEIVNAYQEQGKEMVISVDEATKTITILTRKFADAKGLPIFPLKAE